MLYRIFQQSIHSAQSLAASIDRPILLYCEEEPDEVIPSLPTFLLRRALASKKVGSMINQQVRFCFNNLVAILTKTNFTCKHY